MALLIAGTYAEAISGSNSTQEILSAFGLLFERFGIFGGLVIDLPHAHMPLLPYIRLRIGAEEWIDRYTTQDYVHRDFVARQVRIGSKPFLWSEALATCNPTQDELRIIDEARNSGILDGYTVPLHGPFLRVSSVNYFMNEGSPAQADRIALNLIASLTHNRLDEISEGFAPLENPPVDKLKLTRQELECIRWAMDGFKSKEIAFLLGLSVRTVDTYISNAMHKFGVKSRIELVKVILSRGLINTEQTNKDKL